LKAFCFLFNSELDLFAEQENAEEIEDEEKCAGEGHDDEGLEIYIDVI